LNPKKINSTSRYKCGIHSIVVGKDSKNNFVPFLFLIQMATMADALRSHGRTIFVSFSPYYDGKTNNSIFQNHNLPKIQKCLGMGRSSGIVYPSSTLTLTKKCLFHIFFDCIKLHYLIRYLNFIILQKMSDHGIFNSAPMEMPTKIIVDRQRQDGIAGGDWKSGGRMAKYPRVHYYVPMPTIL
jgi:hypothetical protein